MDKIRITKCINANRMKGGQKIPFIIIHVCLYENANERFAGIIKIHVQSNFQ